MNNPQQPGQPGQPPPGMPQQTNPALQGGQPGMAQPQYPQQPPQQSGLVDAQQRPVSSQQYVGIGINPDGPQLPCPVGDDGQLGPASSQLLYQMMIQATGGNAPASVILTWVEVSMALSLRDLNAAWLERRISDLEAKVGVQGITFEAFMGEKQQEYAAAMQQQQQQQPPQGQPQGGQPQAGQPQPGQPQQPQSGQPPQGQPPGGHGMPGGPQR
jgi:hypothetical protein